MKITDNAKQPSEVLILRGLTAEISEKMVYQEIKIIKIDCSNTLVDIGQNY